MKLQEFLNSLGGEEYKWNNFSIVTKPLSNGFNFIDKKRNISIFVELGKNENFVFFHEGERVEINGTKETD